MNAATQQEFCVRWNSHLGSIGAAFPQLLAGQRFVDVTLACEGHQVHCHRLVLAACSTYFEAILAENPCKHPVIILPSEIKLWEIQALVDFMYKGEVNVTQAGLGQLLRCAEQLRIRGLYGSEAVVNYKQLQQLQSQSQSGPVLREEIVKPLQQQKESGETDDTATNSTVQSQSTTTSTLIKQQQLKRQQQQQTNGNLQLMLLQQQQIQQQQIQQQQHTNSIVEEVGGEQGGSATSNNSNDPPEDDSGDDEGGETNVSNNWNNTYTENYDEYLANNKINTQLQVQQKQLHLQQQHQLDSTIEDDHNYVAAHDEDNDGSLALGSNILSSSFVFESELNNSGNTSGGGGVSGGSIQTSLDGYTSYKRVRRSEASLAQAAKCVSKGETFQTVSNMFNIPVSTIRFYMARKGILPKRKRGRGASNAGSTITTPAAITLGNSCPTASAVTAAATMAAATTLGSLSTVGAQGHVPEITHSIMDVAQLKRLKGSLGEDGGDNSSTNTTASLDMVTSAAVPYHVLTDATATFKLSEQAHMI